MDYANIVDFTSSHIALPFEERTRAAHCCAIYLCGPSLTKVSEFTGLSKSELIPTFDWLHESGWMAAGELPAVVTRKLLRSDSFFEELKTQRAAMNPRVSPAVSRAPEQRGAKVKLVRRVIREVAAKASSPFGVSQVRAALAAEGVSNDEVSGSVVAEAFGRVVKESAIHMVQRPGRGRLALYQCGPVLLREPGENFTGVPDESPVAVATRGVPVPTVGGDGRVTGTSEAVAPTSNPVEGEMPASVVPPPSPRADYLSALVSLRDSLYADLTAVERVLQLLGG